jgi:UDP-N-acetylmuramate--alanine ligase
MADALILTDIYPAGEEPIEGVTAEALAATIGERGHRNVAYAGDLKASTARLVEDARDGDVVLTLGAGSVSAAGDELLKRRGGAA